MSPRMVVHPPSITDSSVISHEDDIPPQPLDHESHYQNGLSLASSHDSPDLDSPLQSPDTIGPNNSQRKVAVAFHGLPIEVLERCAFMKPARFWSGARC